MSGPAVCTSNGGRAMYRKHQKKRGGTVMKVYDCVPGLEFDESVDFQVSPCWFHDATHSVPPWTPMFGWFWINFCRHGMQYGAEKLSLPTVKGWDWRFKDGAGYLALLIVKDPAERRAREERFKVAIKPFIDDFPGMWKGFVDEIVGKYEKLKALDLDKATNTQLLENFEELGVGRLIRARALSFTYLPMSKRALLAGKHVFCEKPLAHSCAQAREIRELAKQLPKLATQVGSQGGATDTFRRSMEVIQAGVLGEIREVHVWMDRGCEPSRNYDKNADPIPPELNWDFWCGPSKVLPFKNHYLNFCLNWGPWLDFGDGHLADMGAHGMNLPWRALKLGAALNCSIKVPEPIKDSYASATDISWDFAARSDMPAVKVWWHDGGKLPPKHLCQELVPTYGRVPGNGVLFAGSKGLLCSDCWGVGGVVKLKGEAKCRGVQDHEACKPVPVTLPRARPHRGMAPCLQGRPQDVPGLRDRRHGRRDHHGGHARHALQARREHLLHDRLGQRGAEGAGRAQCRRRRTPPRSAQVAVRRRQKTTVSQQNSWVRSGRYAREVQHPAPGMCAFCREEPGTEKRNYTSLGKVYFLFSVPTFQALESVSCFPT